MLWRRYGAESTQRLLILLNFKSLTFEQTDRTALVISVAKTAQSKCSSKEQNSDDLSLLQITTMTTTDSTHLMTCGIHNNSHTGQY